jgi:hypothetical protein
MRESRERSIGEKRTKKKRLETTRGSGEPRTAQAKSKGSSKGEKEKGSPHFSISKVTSVPRPWSVNLCSAHTASGRTTRGISQEGAKYHTLLQPLDPVFKPLIPTYFYYILVYICHVLFMAMV